MKAQILQANVKRVICLLWVYLMLVLRSDIVEAQENRSPFYLPDINLGIEFELEYVFKSHPLHHNLFDKDNTNTDESESMLLIGTMINGESRIAWIQTHENQVYELSVGQRVPGSALRVDRVYSDSVELVDNDQCQQQAICDPQLVLELN